jgi:acetyl-CoA acyltransferase
VGDAVIIDGVRTPVGRYGGALASVRPDDLAALVLRALVDRVGLDPGELEDVYLGCANQAGEDNRNVARMAVLLAGFPVEVAGCTVNRLCGSGLEAVADAARAISHGDGQAIIAGGVESMSRAPWVTAKPDHPYPRGERVIHDSALGWRFINPKMEELYGTDSMGQTAENVAQQFSVDRRSQDQFALNSHRRALEAQRRGNFSDELIAVETKLGAVVADEGPRPDSSLERLSQLKPAFAIHGSVTAGNSSPLNDGAAALLLTSSEFAESRGLRPMAMVRGMAVAGVPPRLMGIGPVAATRKVLERARLRLADIDLIELNEAFAAQAVAVLKELGLDPDDHRVNPNGGAIALGHALGCSGSRILVTLIHELRRRQLRFGLATMCIGVGQGIAMVVENLR